jgi:TonB family protein
MKTIRNIVIMSAMMLTGLKTAPNRRGIRDGRDGRRIVALALVALIHLAPFLAFQLSPDLLAAFSEKQDGPGWAVAPALTLINVVPSPPQPATEIQPVAISVAPSIPTPPRPSLVMPVIPIAKVASTVQHQPPATTPAVAADSMPNKATDGENAPQQSGHRHAQSSTDDRVGGGQITDAYLAELLEWINRQKRYPADAAARRITGDVVLMLVVDRWGRLRTLSLHRSSGERSLDLAALAQVKRASPLPRPDAPDWETKRFEITVRFELADLQD